jgi:hypothetical protein
MNQHSKHREMCEIFQIYLCIDIMIEDQVEQLISRVAFDAVSLLKTFQHATTPGIAKASTTYISKTEVCSVGQRITLFELRSPLIQVDFTGLALSSIFDHLQSSRYA